jgi:hypothetical protein
VINDDVVRCPLCGEVTHIENPGLLQALNIPAREQMERYVTQSRSSRENLGSAAAPEDTRDFRKMLGHWNSSVPISGGARNSRSG